MNIYYMNNAYPEERCVINKVSDLNYVSISLRGDGNRLKWMIEKVVHFLEYQYSQYRGEKALSCYWLSKRNGIVHTFNRCISGNNKWCATFETILPRTNYTRLHMFGADAIDGLTLKQFKMLAKDNCLGCMALSQTTYNYQMYALEEIKNFLLPEELEAIKNKTYVLHPPQELLVKIEDIIKKFNECDVLELIFVGHDFFRKGGKELIDCLLENKKESSDEFSLRVGERNVHLTVVSCMNYGDYASHATQEEMIRYREILEDEVWITFYENLPNQEVLELCKKAHIGLLPTFADTYGYSVLEMQACGCAMLTTDVRALPEINDESCGWVCHLPQNDKKEALYQTEEMRIQLKKVLKEELEEQLDLVFNANQSELQQKAINSWKRIEENHSPRDYAEKLKKIWDLV